MNWSREQCGNKLLVYNTFQNLFLLWSELKVIQSCLTLCDPMDYTTHGIFQARILEWVAVPFSRGSSNPGIKPRSPTLQVDSLPAGEAQEYWSRQPIASPVDLPNLGIKPGSPALREDSLPFWASREALMKLVLTFKCTVGKSNILWSSDELN